MFPRYSILSSASKEKTCFFDLVNQNQAEYSRKRQKKLQESEKLLNNRLKLRNARFFETLRETGGYTFKDEEDCLAAYNKRLTIITLDTHRHLPSMSFEQPSLIVPNAPQVSDSFPDNVGADFSFLSASHEDAPPGRFGSPSFLPNLPGQRSDPTFSMSGLIVPEPISQQPAALNSTLNLGENLSGVYFPNSSSFPENLPGYVSSEEEVSIEYNNSFESLP
ncbi:hypothetical protein DSO57_1032470 [Entomophthora muscae]|uniref:Uncharacterized protein n=1 Tax=Entomophthora muscae TaxID=34485 RepID=A0ACC2TYJ5_9FUNG|nr:hypothetical protein DSO57_1032470 [Entomophthora muscae]